MLIGTKYDLNQSVYVRRKRGETIYSKCETCKGVALSCDNCDNTGKTAKTHINDVWEKGKITKININVNKFVEKGYIVYKIVALTDDTDNIYVDENEGLEAIKPYFEDIPI